MSSTIEIRLVERIAHGLTVKIDMLAAHGLLLGDAGIDKVTVRPSAVIRSNESAQIPYGIDIDLFAPSFAITPKGRPHIHSLFFYTRFDSHVCVCVICLYMLDANGALAANASVTIGFPTIKEMYPDGSTARVAYLTDGTRSLALLIVGAPGRMADPPLTLRS